MSVVTLHAVRVWEAGAADLGLLFSLMGISYVVGMPVGGWLANRVGRKALIVPGLLLSNVAFGGLAFVGDRESFMAFLCCSHLLGAAAQPAVGAFTAEVLPAHVRGQAMSVARMCSDSLGMVAPIALGVIADYTDCATAILVAANMTGACTAVFALRAQELSGTAATESFAPLEVGKSKWR